MIFRLLILVCVWLLSLGAAQAQSLSCAPKSVNVSVETSTAPTEYIKTQSSADLTKLHGQGAQNIAVGGLGGGLLGFKTEVRFEILTRGRNSCVTMKDLDIEFFAKPTIHIASNFRRGTCEYNAVHAHEKKHVRELLKFVREVSPDVRAHIKDKIRRMQTAIGPIQNAEIQNAQEFMQDIIIKDIEALNAELIPILSERQQAIDNPREYRDVSDKCKDWNKKLYQDR